MTATVATITTPPKDYMARKKNAEATIFSAIRDTAISIGNDILTATAEQRYYWTDYSLPNKYPGLDGKKQMGVITSVDFAKRDQIAKDVEKAMFVLGIEDEKLETLCSMYRRVRQLNMPNDWLQLWAIREQLKQQVSGCNAIF